jgi:hypothetical protein
MRENQTQAAATEQARSELDGAAAALRKEDEEMRDLRREVRHARRVVKTYEKTVQSLTKGVAGGEVGIDGAQKTGVFRCSQCGANFASEDFLFQHHQRRHPHAEPPSQFQSVPPPDFQKPWGAASSSPRGSSWQGGPHGVAPSGPVALDPRSVSFMEDWSHTLQQRLDHFQRSMTAQLQQLQVRHVNVCECA